MRRSIFVLLVLLLANTFYSLSQELDIYLEKEKKLERNSMIVLTSWGGLNLATGLIGWNTTKGESSYFNQMNASWGLINAGIGTAALLIHKEKSRTAPSALEASHRTEKVLLLNTGLDVAYVTAGFLFRSESKNNLENADRFRGFGNSLLMQGGFLLLFDIAQLILHTRHRNLNKKILWDNLSMSDSGLGVKYTIQYN
jgi:hypothetical protein